MRERETGERTQRRLQGTARKTGCRRRLFWHECCGSLRTTSRITKGRFELSGLGAVCLLTDSLRSIYVELADQYKDMDPVSNVVKRNVLADHLREVIDILEQKVGDSGSILFE